MKAFAQLRNARVLLTGGTGFFGRWLTSTFLRENEALGLGATLTVVTRDARRVPDGARGIVTDIRELVVEETFTHVIHAAMTSSAPVEPAEATSTIVDGTKRVLEQCRAAQRILYVSSGAVYGRQEATHVTEDATTAPDPLDPTRAYGNAKRYAEHLCALESNVTVARPFAFVGPHLPLDAHFAIGNFLRDALAAQPIVVRGDGSAIRSYLYAADLATWLWTILATGAPRRAYNVGSERAVSIGELAKLIGAMFSVPVEIRGAPTSTLDRYVPSTRRAREELGLAETVGLEDALARTASFIRGAR